MDFIAVIDTLFEAPTPEALTIVEFRIEYLEHIDGPVCRILSTLGLDRVHLTPIEYFTTNDIEEILTTQECFDTQVYLSDSLAPLGLHAALEIVEIEDYSPRWMVDPETWLRVR